VEDKTYIVVICNTVYNQNAVIRSDTQPETIDNYRIRQGDELCVVTGLKDKVLQKVATQFREDIDLNHSEYEM
jgi:hypothetical protein